MSNLHTLDDEQYEAVIARLERFIQDGFGSSRTLATAIGVTAQHLNIYMRGGGKGRRPSRMGFDLLRRLSAIGLNIDWLMLLDEEMLRPGFTIAEGKIIRVSRDDFPCTSDERRPNAPAMEVAVPPGGAVVVRSGSTAISIANTTV